MFSISDRENSVRKECVITLHTCALLQYLCIMQNDLYIYIYLRRNPCQYFFVKRVKTQTNRVNNGIPRVVVRTHAYTLYWRVYTYKWRQDQDFWTQIYVYILYNVYTCVFANYYCRVYPAVELPWRHPASPPFGSVVYSSRRQILIFSAKHHIALLPTSSYRDSPENGSWEEGIFLQNLRAVQEVMYI